MDESRIKESLGLICWLEIPVKDISRAQKFYTDMFGWECDAKPTTPPYCSSPSAPTEFMFESYYFFKKGEALNGAFMLGKGDHQVLNYDPSRPPAYALQPTIHVVDCAEALRLAESLGGKTHWPKSEIGGDMGFFARVIDTEGNVIGLWSYK